MIYPVSKIPTTKNQGKFSVPARTQDAKCPEVSYSMTSHGSIPVFAYRATLNAGTYLDVTELESIVVVSLTRNKTKSPSLVGGVHRESHEGETAHLLLICCRTYHTEGALPNGLKRAVPSIHAERVIHDAVGRWRTGRSRTVFHSISIMTRSGSMISFIGFLAVGSHVIGRDDAPSNLKNSTSDCRGGGDILVELSSACPTCLIYL